MVFGYAQSLGNIHVSTRESNDIFVILESFDEEPQKR